MIRFLSGGKKLRLGKLMERLFEFIGNNLFWASLWIAILMLLIWNLFSDVIMGIVQLEPMDVTRRINHDNATVIDLRSPAEFEAGHIINSLNIPESELSERTTEISNFNKSPVILYCQSGTISARAVKQLKANGFEDVSSMKGGILTWQRASLPLSRGETKA
jgi:rhodanese-related sulfurtransferase